MNQNKLLEGKAAIVTGGTRGIGFEITERFLQNGAKVALFGSRQETVDNALSRLKEYGGSVMGLHPKLDDPGEIKDAFEKVVKEFGALDILVNNAGVTSDTSIFDYTLDEFKKEMNINVVGPFVCSQAAARIMKENKRGVILNTSSMVTIYGQGAGVGYPASKYAVNGLTVSLARELGSYGIRVNAVAPGVTRTDMLKNVPDEMLKPVIAKIPLGKIGEPIDVANAFLFLASDMASYISGSILYVDGACAV